MRSVLLLSLIAMTVAMREQSIAVRGKLLCGSKPASNVRVKLWEEDTGPDPDDLLDQGYTDENGEFELSGNTIELTPIDPVFKVYHDCDDGIKPGSRKVKFALPKSYITNGKTPKKTFDIGVLNLETIFAKEEREFIVTRMRRGGIYERYINPDLYESFEDSRPQYFL
ncbi:Transthyretin-like protein 46 [Parelaphostrongylus tenuis]|uniref:Transthyretin-like protein 46 n=1 Tax=Parelaphostrongylus tenuis TaxID=148309 RepID=A0AAD5M241_PARTN|nr:Transthyretin-like protein 46 [Parelaphostrongylus tenuis]